MPGDEINAADTAGADTVNAGSAPGRVPRKAPASEEVSQADGNAAEPQSPASEGTAPPNFDDSITGELAALLDDGRTYAEAELAFQKTRAKLVGRNVAVAIACVVLAIVLLHIAFLALAVGLVIALAPLVTIWGAIAIVVGGLMALVAMLGLKAKSSGTKLAALFASTPKDDAQ